VVVLVAAAAVALPRRRSLSTSVLHDHSYSDDTICCIHAI
jgi:hypothetical protein